MSVPPLTAAVLLGAVLVAAPALGDGPTLAQSLFERGIEDLKAGRYDEACPALEQSYKLDPRPGELFTLAECEAKRGRLATAVKEYEAYLAVYASLPPDKQAWQGERARIALARRSAIEPHVPELTLVLPPDAPRGTLVIRNGTPVAASEIGVPVSVDPGEYVILVQAPDEPVVEVRVTLVPREKLLLPLRIRRSETPSADAYTATQTPAGSGAVRPRVAVTIAGAAVAGTAAVVGTLLAALSAQNGSEAADLHGSLPAGGCLVTSPSGPCADLRSAYARRDALGNGAIWCFIGAGGVGAGTLIHALVTRKAAPDGLRLAPALGAGGGGFVAAGSF